MAQAHHLANEAEVADSVDETPDKDTDSDRKIVAALRFLIAHSCNQFRGGHPGGAMGAAAIGVALWKYVMRYDPKSPELFNRDRFVLSNGHTALLQYYLMHFCGYTEMTMEQINLYHSGSADALCTCHPERRVPGVEVTTGPLGQGLANSVGLAIASKHLAAQFNRPCLEVVNNHTWCLVGDGCLQEGIALEAISLAGHLKLDNLTVIYDNNQVCCDGPVSLCNSEDCSGKMLAAGWNVLNVDGGSDDVQAIVNSLLRSRHNPSKKPTFINIRTIIGVGSAFSGDCRAHYGAISDGDLRMMKKACGFGSMSAYEIAADTKRLFSDVLVRGSRLSCDYARLLEEYAKQHPDGFTRLTMRFRGDLPDGWLDLLSTKVTHSEMSTRSSWGNLVEPMYQCVEALFLGTADIPLSNYLDRGPVGIFQAPETNDVCARTDGYSGRYLYYGAREHAMVAIANGLAAFAPNAIIPITSTFLNFYMYAVGAIRMGALQKLHTIHVASHDSIGIGDLGPTHQPVEVATLLRAMPDILFLRPADTEETAGAWITAVTSKAKPSIIALCRQQVPQLLGTARAQVRFGAYVVHEPQHATVTILGSGSELHLAVGAANLLQEKGINARVVSFPCHQLFLQQSILYQRTVLKRHLGIQSIVVEASSSVGWERFADAGLTVNQFGTNLHCNDAYKHFGLEPKVIAHKIIGYLASLENSPELRYEYTTL